jgi:hypothetical protein
MKTFLTLILILLPFLCASQVKYELNDAIKSVVNRGLSHGVDLTPLMEKHIDTIVMRSNNELKKYKTKKYDKILGLAHYLETKDGNYIWELRINSDLHGDFNVMELVVAHEIGHALHLKHCCDKITCMEIMSAGAPDIPGTGLYYEQYESEYEVLYWAKFFLDIKINNGLIKLD